MSDRLRLEHATLEYQESQKRVSELEQRLSDLISAVETCIADMRAAGLNRPELLTLEGAVGRARG